MAIRWARTARLAEIVLLGTLAAASASAAPGFKHVRSDDASIRQMLVDGYARSATFRTLVDRIELLPGIVYVQPIAKLSRGMDAGLLHTVSGSAAMPVLRVVVRSGIAGDYAIGVLAHELQHVAEALSRADLFDSRAMTAVFQALDAHESAGAGVNETDDARDVAARVLNELHTRLGRVAFDLRNPWTARIPRNTNTTSTMN